MFLSQLQNIIENSFSFRTNDLFWKSYERSLDHFWPFFVWLANIIFIRRIEIKQILDFSITKFFMKTKISVWSICSKHIVKLINSELFNKDRAWGMSRKQLSEAFSKIGSDLSQSCFGQVLKLAVLYERFAFLLKLIF